MNSPLGNANPMLHAQNPSGTIHVTGVGNNGVNQNNSTVTIGMMSTDFKSTMKHQSSNSSIQSNNKNQKMIATIRKPTDFIGGGPTGIKKGGNNYLSPYSQKMNMKGNADSGGRN